MHTPDLLQRSAKASREQVGNGVRYISCEIFWHIFLTRTKISLLRASKPSGWPPPRNRLANWLRKSAGSTSAGFPKLFVACRMD